MRIYHHRLALCLLLLPSCFAPQEARAATLVDAQSSLCEKKLQGPIENGDLKTFEALLSERSRVCLNSPGGSYIEGVQLFAFFTKNRIATVVDSSDECLSACAIAFMGGSDGRYGDRFPDRTIHANGRLGFHSPFLARDVPAPADAADQLRLGVAVGIAVVAKLIRSDKHNLWPRALLADMLETPASSLHEIDTFKKARAAKIAVTGLKQPDKITKRMLYQACLNSDPWHDSASIDPNEAPPRESGVVEKGNVYRIKFDGFGFKAMETCAVDVVSRPQRAQIRVQMGSDKMMPPGSAGIDEVPVWYLYPGEALISRYSEGSSE